MKKRILPLFLAVVMLSALVLNISAASYPSSYNRETDRGGYCLYASASCTATSAQVSTSTDSRTVLVKSRIHLYNAAAENDNTLYYLNSSIERTGTSGLSVSTSGLHHCKGDHYEDGIIFTRGRVYVN